MKEALQEQFLTLHEEYADVVFRMCLSKVSSREEAKDLAQEAFVRVWERLSKGGEDIENMRAFLFTVARNLIKDHYKRKKPVLARDLPEGAMENVPVAATAETSSEVSLALSAIGALPAPYREAVHLHLVEGYGIGEIAEVLKERPNTISVRIKRGLAKVRVTLRTNTP
jgi:RNA polymerase sigma-70 factor, ECF subfamily